jgi:ribosomal protein L12E/L44/L45/RPP1/RPP2
VGSQRLPEGDNYERAWEEMGMRTIFSLILAFVFLGSAPAPAFSEEVFAPVKKVYMNDGKVIECQMGWLDGAKMVCRKFGGNVTLQLHSVDFEKTFPKYKKAEGETVLLVHPGPRYQDENIVISNVRMVRLPESNAKSSCVVVCETLNRGDPCEVRVVVNAVDAQGRVLDQVDISSPSRLDTGETSVLKRRLDSAGAALENQMISLKVSRVERSHVEETLLSGKKAASGTPGSGPNGLPNSAREEKIRALKETFLKESPSSR